MQIKVGAEGDGDSAYIPASSGSTFFTDQALQASQLGNCQNLHRRSEIVRNPVDVRELMVAREMEKRRIREEIITTGLLRRRELEAEVIREMMMEREFSMRRGGGEGLCLMDSLLQSEVQGLLALSRPDEIGVGIAERLVGLSRPEGGIDGSGSLVSCPKGVILGSSPFQRQPGATSAAANAAKPHMNECSEGQVSLVNPINSSVAGTKRKFEALLTEGGEGTPSVNLSKMSQKKWKCAACQVTTSCEQGLKDHLKGRKHKAKVALLRTGKTVSDKADNSEALAEETENTNERVVPTGSMRPNLGKCLDGNLEDMNDLEAVDDRLQHNEDLKKINGGAEVSKKQTNTDFKCWCTLCNVGTASEAQMTVHRMGKKHMTLLKEKGGAVIAIKTMPDNIEYINKTKDPAAKGEEESLCNADAEADGVGADQKEDAAGGELETVSVN